MTEQEATRLLALLYETHQRPITGFLLSLVHDEQYAADLCQDTFLKAWDYLNRQDANVPRTENHMKNWLYEIARNLAHDHHRKHSKLQFYSLLDGIELMIDGHEERLIERIQLYELLAELPPQQQKALIGRYMIGDSEIEVAADLDITPKAVSSNASRGKEQLSKKLYQVNINIQVMEAKTAIRRSSLKLVPVNDLMPDEPCPTLISQYDAEGLCAMDDDHFKLFFLEKIMWQQFKFTARASRNYDREKLYSYNREVIGENRAKKIRDALDPVRPCAYPF